MLDYGHLEKKNKESTVSIKKILAVFDTTFYVVRVWNTKG